MPETHVAFRPAGCLEPLCDTCAELQAEQIAEAYFREQLDARTLVPALRIVVPSRSGLGEYAHRNPPLERHQARMVPREHRLAAPVAAQRKLALVEQGKRKRVL